LRTRWREAREALETLETLEALETLETMPSETSATRPSRLRVGVDLVSVRDVARSLERFGERYVRRVFTAHEAAYCRAATGRAAAARFAVRFAAKEAALKALQPGKPWAGWRAIEVRRHASGWCEIVLHGEAAALARRQGIETLALSMSHDGGRAAAVVVAQALRLQRGSRVGVENARPAGHPEP
jgi:holo-[acyl-carrier protein] synthase